MNLCSQTQRSFDVIGVSETWKSVLNVIVVNIDINGYKRYDTGSMSSPCPEEIGARASIRT